MRVAQIGNFRPPYSTENDLRLALTNIGHTVAMYQEGDRESLDHLIHLLTTGNSPDFILWTRTRDLAAQIGHAGWWELIARARRADVPIIGYHLDRWWGLERAKEIADDPFFHVDLLCTADGAHDTQWRSLGINHQWMPPGVSEASCFLGTPRPEFESDIAFVGSWRGYHPEWKHRAELVSWLQRTYGKRVAFWPKPGEHAIRGRDLADLYVSVKVVVGDSCLVPAFDGSPMTRYCSDRIPETLGRGGILAHPRVEGITGLFQHHAWTLGDWKGLRTLIDMLLHASDTINRQDSVDHIRENHTYEKRMAQLVEGLG